MATIEQRFTYHPPKGDQPERYGQVRAAALEFANLLVKLCPQSRELDNALDGLDVVVMQANAAIARNE